MTYQPGPAEIPGGDRTFLVAADQDITQYAAVIQEATPTANMIDMPSAAGAIVWGFAQESVDYSEGQHTCRVRCFGFTKVIAFDGDIVAGDFLQVGDALGRVDTATTGDYVIARACEESAAAGDIIVAMILPGGYVSL